MKRSFESSALNSASEDSFSPTINISDHPHSSVESEKKSRSLSVSNEGKLKRRRPVEIILENGAQEEKEKHSVILSDRSSPTQSLYFHPIGHGSAGLLAVASAYGRGLVSTARFYLAWQFFQMMLGKRLIDWEPPLPASPILTVFFFLTPLILAVDWGVNSYNSSLMLVHEYKEKRKKTARHPIVMISKTLRRNTLAVLLGWIGAIGHSFVVHHSILELAESYDEQSAMQSVFAIFSWFFPVVCSLQYLFTEVPHTTESLKRPFIFDIFDDYSNGMLIRDNGVYRPMTRFERGWRIASMNAVAVVTALMWGSLECTETYLTLRRHLHRNGIALSNEIALLVGIFFGLLGAYNTFIADGERFKCFVTYPYRDLIEKEKEVTDDKDVEKRQHAQQMIELVSRRIPQISLIPRSVGLSLKLFSTGLLSAASSVGLGVVSATSLPQLVNVFVQFYDSEKPLYASWWLMMLSAGVGVITASVFWISKGRYIYSRWRHKKAKKLLWTQEKWKKHHKAYLDHRETAEDKKNVHQGGLSRELKSYYDIHHGALDFLQVGCIFLMKLFVELYMDVNLPFLVEVAMLYLATLSVGVFLFGCEELFSARRAVKLDGSFDRNTGLKVIRAMTQCMAQLLIPLIVGVLSEWTLHGWVLNEPISEQSRLTFAHVAGTFIAAVSAVVTKRLVDVTFSDLSTYWKWAFSAPKDQHRYHAHPLIYSITDYHRDRYDWHNFSPFHLFRKVSKLGKEKVDRDLIVNGLSNASLYEGFF